MFGFPLRGRRHWQRYREIAQVLFRHGFDQLIDLLELAPFISWPTRWFRRDQVGESLTAPRRLRLAIEQLGPTFIKLGQVLSTRPDLVPPDYIAELSKLQDAVPPFPSGAACAIVENELGRPVEEMFASFEETPIAAASLGQVHRAVLKDGSRVVAKVQRPNIQEIINTDLEILFDWAGLVQRRTPLGRMYDLGEMAEDFAATLRAELDYEREGRNADRFRQNFQGDEGVYIPRVHWDYTTSRVLVLEEIEGIPIDDLAALDAAGVNRKDVAAECSRLIIVQVMRDHFFHADPHPGNFFVMLPSAPGGFACIGAMDFGMVGEIDEEMREHLARLMVAMVRRNPEGIVDEFVRIGVVEWGKFDRRRLERDIRRILTRYLDSPIRTWRAREMMNDLAPVAFRHHLRFPADWWLLAKVLAMSEGIAQQLDPQFDVFRAAEPYARELYADMLSPGAIGKRAVNSLTDWGEELLLLPQQLRHIVERIEGGDLRLVVREEERSSELQRMDRMASRLAASLLIAAFVVAVSLLVPLLASEQWRLLAIVLIVLGFVNATILMVWLVLSSLPTRPS